MFNRLSSLSNRTVLLILISVALLSSGLSLLVNLTSTGANFADWGESWLQNFSTEMFGAFLTFILIELIVGGRQKRTEEENAIQQEKERLKRELGSRVNDDAIRAKGWLEDGTLTNVNLTSADLQNVNFENANLQGSRLSSANLQEAELTFANLQQVSFEYAKMQKARLGAANLQRAFLRGTKLEHAHLQFTNLQDTVLDSANLQQANLAGANLHAARLYAANLQAACLDKANLQAADLTNAQFNRNTILPDGTKWTSETDMHRFTDPNHPKFWCSDAPISPAYSDKAVKDN